MVGWVEIVERIEAEAQERISKLPGGADESTAKRTAAVMMLFETAGVPDDGPAETESGNGHLGRRSSRRPRPLRVQATGD